MEKALLNLENLYDIYSPMLFSLALEITNSKKSAEEILVNTFIKIDRLKIAEEHHVSLSGKFIKLLVQTAKTSINPQNLTAQYKLQRFEKTPITKDLLFEQIGFENYCTENSITRLEAAKKIRQELKAIRAEYDTVRVNLTY